MKKSWLSILSLCFFGMILNVSAADRNPASSQSKHAKPVTLSFYWSNDCPHCVRAHPFLDKLKKEYPRLHVSSYEISSPANRDRFQTIARKYGQSGFVPAFVVCNRMIVGFSSEDSTGAEIKQAISHCY